MSYIKFRAYYDSYQNSIFDYTNDTYSQISTNGMFRPTGKSRYDDFSHGMVLEAGTMAISSHSLKAIIQTKTDVHREDDYSRASTAEWPHFEDRYLSCGVEDSITLSPTLDLSLGLGWDKQKPVDSGPTWSLPSVKSFFHGQMGLFWKVTPRVKAYVTAAQKDHFPTLKDRYSLRFATFIENPGLEPETSTNYEIGVKASPADWLTLEATVFRSDIRDLIQEVKNVQGTKSQMQNIGKVENSGVELALGVKPSAYVQAGLGYTYLDRSNHSNTNKLTSTPAHRFTGHVRVDPCAKFYLLASLQAQDALWDSNTVRLGGFTTVNLTLGWQPRPSLLFDGGFTNLLDRNYQLTSGYPLPGRTWFLNGRYRF